MIVTDAGRCWSKRWLGDGEERCPNAAVWRSTAPACEAMVWCALHAPLPEYREPYRSEPDEAKG